LLRFQPALSLSASRLLTAFHSLPRLPLGSD
jgi:hypothetical protein